jgi:hypothetical protein
MKLLFRAIHRALRHGWRYVEGGPGWQTLWHPNTRWGVRLMLMPDGAVSIERI